MATTDAQILDIGPKNTSLNQPGAQRDGNIVQHFASFVDMTLIEAPHCDAALLDLNLNGVRRYPVADVLSAHGEPFAFATASGESGLRDGDRDRSLLVKPFGFASEESMLTALLSTRSGRILM